MQKKLFRDEKTGMIGGVCSGLAQYFEVDVSVVRLVVALMVFVGGVSLWAYLIAWVVLPDKSKIAWSDRLFGSRSFFR